MAPGVLRASLVAHYEALGDGISAQHVIDAVLRRVR